MLNAAMNLLMLLSALHLFFFSMSVAYGMDNGDICMYMLTIPTYLIDKFNIFRHLLSEMAECGASPSFIANVFKKR